MSFRSKWATQSRDEQPSLWRNRNFLHFFFGKFVTNVGDSLYHVATLWLVYELSESTTLTGIASSMLLLPYLLQIIVGPIIDRFRVQRLLVATQLVQGVLVFFLSLAAFTGELTVEVIFATIPLLSLLTMVISPAQSAVLPRILPDEQLSQGNSALAAITVGLDMLFDAFGGLFIAISGAAALFFFDSLTFAIAAVLFFGMQIPPRDSAGNSNDEAPLTGYLTDLREGGDILLGTVFVPLLAIAAVSNFAIGVTLAILPAVGDLFGGPAVYGFLLAAMGLGRLLGSVVAPYLRTVPYGYLMLISYLTGTLLWVGAAVSHSVLVTVCLFCLAHIVGGIDGVLTATLNQRVFPTRVLGRVAAIKGTASTATLPLGALVGGFIATTVGVTTTFTLAAAGFGFMTLCFAAHPSLRRLPPVSDADPVDFGLDLSPSEQKADNTV